MVNFAALSTFGTAILVAQVALGAPSRKRQDSAIGQEVAVSAPDGTPITDTAELASQTASEASESAKTAAAYQTTSAAEYNTYSSSVAYDTSSVAYETSSVAYETSSVAYETSSVAYETSSVAYETASSSAAYETSVAYGTSSVWDSTSSVAYDTTSTAYSSVATYGSGSSNWGNSGYNDCVQQCIASFGAPPATYTAPTATETQTGYGGSTGTGTTHMIVVAPTKGVFRYVPFAVNASVGDTIKFMWGADMHTVTKSSELELCNKTSDSPFTSGVQNKSFTFTQVVNSTDPTFFYCGVPTHCQKGMFGIINPPNADVASNTSVASMMPTLVSNSSDVSMWNTYTQNVTASSPQAAAWGNAIDMGSMPSWANEVVAENVMYTRNFLAMNSKVMQEDGSIDMSATGGEWTLPTDFSAVTASAKSDDGSSSANPSATGGAANAANSGSAAPSSSPSASGARGLTASFSLAGIVALGVAFLAL